MSTTQNGLQLTEERLDSTGLLLTAAGELDMATAPALRVRLNAAIDAGVNRLVVDLTPVSFMDSIALATVVHAKQRLGDDGRMAIVVAPDSYVMLILECGGLPTVLDIVESREAGLAHIAS